MSTVIAGNNHAYTSANILAVNGGVIVREPTALSSDDFAFTGADFLTACLGPNASAANVGYSVTVTVRNNSAFVISQGATSADVTLSVPAGLKIPSRGSRTFTFILTDFATKAFYAQVADYYETVVLRESSVGGTNNTTLKSPATLASDLSITLPATAGSAGYFLSTDGSGVTSWEPDSLASAPLIFALGPAAPASVAGTYATIVLSSAPVNPSAELTLAAGSITLSGAASTGIYEVSYWAQFQSNGTSGSARASLGCRLFLTPSVGPGAEAAGSVAECYLREQNGPVVRPGCGKTILMSLNSGDTVALQVARTIGTSTGDVIATQCTLVLAKLR